MRQRILSAVLALCLCVSSLSAAHAFPKESLPQEDLFIEKSMSRPALYDSTSQIPTPAEVYEAMVALKGQDTYEEGAAWTNETPYSSSTPYRWNGGTLNGKNISAVGCVAFAFILSDAAFGSLPARMYSKDQFTFEDVKVGDILRTNTDTHTVIVLETNETGLIVAEGNISTGDHQGKVHWGRAISKEEFERDASSYITRYPEGYIPPDDPSANESIAAGTLNGGLTWNLTKAGTLTISGKGAMPDFNSVNEPPWSDKSSQIRKVVIENGVTSIGACAFWDCGVLSAEIASSVTLIGNSAFRGSSIISTTIPASVKTIGDSAFRSCQNLSSVTFSEGLEKIEQNAFQACTGLTSINLPASITEIGAGTFWQCSAMRIAAFAPGSKQVKLGDNLFTQCYNLMSVTLPTSIDRIGEGMFQNCLMLAGLEIPQGAESIGGSAFASCSGLSTVIIPNSVATIGTAAFSACPLKDIYFTGTEAQWNSISKSNDTVTAMSNATIHYNYQPEANKPGGDKPDDNKPGGNESDNNQPDNNTPDDNESGNNQPDNSKPGDNESGNNQPDNSKPDDNESDNNQPGNEQPGDSNTDQEPSQNTGVPFIKGEDGKTGWDAIRAEENNIEEGGVIHVDMNGATVVPGDIFDNIKGQYVTITFDMGDGILWSIDGESITAEQAEDIDLSVKTGTDAIPAEVADPIAGENYSLQISLAHEGEFGFTAVLSLSLPKENAGRLATLYYFNPDENALDWMSEQNVADDGTVRLVFTHASDYLLTVDNQADNENETGNGSGNGNGNGNGNGSGSGNNNENVTGDTQSKAPQTGDLGNGILWWSILAGALAVIIGIAFQKKKTV